MEFRNILRFGEINLPWTMSNYKVFKICTFNCNGINNHKKRKDVFDYLRQQKCDIYFLQETHLTVDSERFLRSGWGFDCYLSGVETNKNSVAILFNNTFEYKIFEVFRDPDGSYIGCWNYEETHHPG